MIGVTIKDGPHTLTARLRADGNVIVAGSDSETGTTLGQVMMRKSTFHKFIRQAYRATGGRKRLRRRVRCPNCRRRMNYTKPRECPRCLKSIDLEGPNVQQSQ
jgi:hypothetical protein